MTDVARETGGVRGGNTARERNGPAQVLKYLSRYTHRIAISNRRLLSIDDRHVRFSYKDYAGGNRPRKMTLEGGEFLRRFLLHTVPRGFMRIRHFGLLANRVRQKNLKLSWRLLEAPPVVAVVTAVEPMRCPVCGCGRLIAGPRLSPRQLAALILRLDSS